MQRVKVFQLFTMSAVLAGQCCLACESRVHDLDRSESERGDLRSAGGLLLDKVQLYWLEQYQRGFSGFEHVLMSCSKQDCDATRKQLVSINRPYWPSAPCVAVGNGIAYWSAPPDGVGTSYAYSPARSPRVEVTVPRGEEGWLQGGEQSGTKQLYAFPGATRCRGFVLGQGELFRADTDGNILAISLSSDAVPRVVATAQRFDSEEFSAGFLADAEHLYWVDITGNIARARKDGTSAVEIIQADAGASSIVVDDNYLYWLDRSARALRRCSLLDCPATSVTLGPIDDDPDMVNETSHTPHALRTHAGSLYWLEGSNGRPSFLHRCPIHGCPEGSTLAVAERMSHYVVDDTGVYAAVVDQDREMEGRVKLEIVHFAQ